MTIRSASKVSANGACASRRSKFSPHTPPRARLTTRSLYLARPCRGRRFRHCAPRKTLRRQHRRQDRHHVGRRMARRMDARASGHSSSALCRSAGCQRIRSSIRRNERFFLEIIGHPDHGVPFGQDRPVLLWLATRAVRHRTPAVRFGAAAEILAEWGMPTNGSHYRWLQDAFLRVVRQQDLLRYKGRTG